MIPNEYQDAFYAGKRGKIVKYCINDAIEIITGQYKGIRCAVISIAQIKPEVIYYVERGDTGELIKIKQNAMKSLKF